jgi:hypothetical protein
MIWACPLRCASGSGYTLQVLIRYAHCGLSAAIPHADARVLITYTHGKKKCFLPHFHSGAGGWANPKTPQKNTSFALGMRRACVLARMVRTAPKR